MDNKDYFPLISIIVQHIYISVVRIIKTKRCSNEWEKKLRKKNNIQLEEFILAM